MPSSRAARRMATPVSGGRRSNVRHEPSDSADTSMPDEPSGRRFTLPAGMGPPSVPRHGHMLPRAEPAGFTGGASGRLPGPGFRRPGSRDGWHDGHMSVVKINAITVPAESGDELARRFAARAGAVDDQDGFEGFELLKPADGRTTWLVVTRWRDDASFEAWLHSPAFGHGHRAVAEGMGGGPAPGPVGVSSELWSYEIAGGSAGKA